MAESNSGADDSTSSGSTADESSDSTGMACESSAPIDAAGFAPVEIPIDSIVSSRADGVGDLDGDGLGDFIMDGMVVFGRENTEPIAVADIQGRVGGLWFGVGDARSLSAAGLFDVGGTPDLLLGEPLADYAGLNVGRIYLLHGKGERVSFLGDINGDGFGDFVFGNPSYDEHRGRALFVFGNCGSSEVTLDDVAQGLGGFALEGDLDTSLGSEVSGIDDINGDGLADALISGGGGSRIVLGSPVG